MTIARKRTGRYRRLTIEQVKERVRAIHGDVVMLDEATYVDSLTKARFIDAKHGEWWAQPTLIMKRRGHPLRGREKTAARKRYSVKHVVELIKAKHSSRITLDESTYVDMQTRARFIDEEQGVWWTTPGSVVSGTGHPARACQRIAASQRISLDTLEARMKEHHGDAVKLDRTTYVGQTRSKARFIDVERGEWWAVVHKVAGGGSHPSRKHEKAAATRRSSAPVEHWKTGELCYVQSSYERAVLLWLNANQHDYDWQVPFETPLVGTSGKRRTYYVDLLIKTGLHAGTYVEIKGRWINPLSRMKWEWFHETHPRSVLWTRQELKALKIL
jgi:hypothetical protein